jgi:hypothetical protein
MADDPSLLRKAATLEAHLVLDPKNPDQLIANVIVTNSGAGHQLPTGAAGTFDSESADYPSAGLDGNPFKIWYSGLTSAGTYTIGYATAQVCSANPTPPGKSLRLCANHFRDDHPALFGVLYSTPLKTSSGVSFCVIPPLRKSAVDFGGGEGFSMIDLPQLSWGGKPCSVCCGELARLDFWQRQRCCS